MDSGFRRNDGGFPTSRTFSTAPRKERLLCQRVGPLRTPPLSILADETQRVAGFDGSGLFVEFNEGSDLHERQ